MTETPVPPARHAVRWEPEAIDQFEALLKAYPEAARPVFPAVHQLAVDPRPAASAQLGASGTYRRLLVGYVRVIYAVSDTPPLVRVILVGRADQTD